MNDNQQYNNQNQVSEDEIDLIALAKTLWEGHKTILKITLIFMAIGLFIAIFSPKEYTASTTMVPQTNGKSIGGNLGGLAAMAGINLGGMSSESGISPALYPQIINSIPFQKELLLTPLTIDGYDEPVSFKEYYTNIYNPDLLSYIKKYTIGLPGLLIKAIKGNPQPRVKVGENIQILSITQEEKELIKILNNQIGLSVNDKEGYLDLSVNMPEALPAAELTKNTQELLQQYIIDFKIKKSEEQLKFIKERYIEKEIEFKTAQSRLANVRDRNRNLITARGNALVERYQAEYDLAFSVYAELAKQLETQQIQVKEDTPVFTILKPVSVPIEKAKPNRPLILIIWTFLGVILGIGIVFGRDFFKRLKHNFEKNK